MTLSIRSAAVRPAMAAALLILAACTTEKIVEVERPPFNPPADAATGFLGYYTVGAKQTTCGNCHADFQGSWAETGHAKAFATLKANKGAQTACYTCHTISEKGNSTTGTAGWDKTQDSTYQDVQCESCHGPGQQHVQGVNAGQIVRPLAQIGVGTESARTGCAECHSGTHHPFVEQWAASRHANVRAGSPSTSSSCTSCHEGRGKLAQLGVTNNYVEKSGSTPQPITCAVCHNPHGSPNDANLRLPVDAMEPTGNLCMSCHLRRGEPGLTSSDPHGPQGAILLGFGGWRPPNFVYDTARIYGSHATSTNPKLCAGCHVKGLTVNDAQGNFQFQSVGHLFKPIPCLDAQGVPTADDSCAFTPAARSWTACTSSGCHANANAAASAFNSTRVEIALLADLLWIDRDADKVIDAAPVDGGYLAKVRQNNPNDFSTTDAVISAANGTEFNVRVCGENRASHPDASKGAHNKFLCVALLSQSASYLLTQYTYLPAPPAEAAALMTQYGAQATAPTGMLVRREKFPRTVE